MPDLLAGTTITAADTPPTVSNAQSGSFTWNLTTYGIDADSGTYVDCGVAFTACTTGRATVSLSGAINGDGASIFALISFVIREGSTVGSGATFLAADDSRCIMHAGTNAEQLGATYLVTGLTPGSTYNVRLEHKVAGAGNATAARRSVTVFPAS